MRAPRASGSAQKLAKRIRADEQSNLPMQDRLSVLDQFDQAQRTQLLERIAIAVVSVRDPSAHGEKRTSRGSLLCDCSAEDVPMITIQAWEHDLLGCSHRGVRLV